ncbi:hypothetical protein [Streptomyces sp. NPDC015131]|uniref:hypothetical protein n=1 Tax=Streptomyces sp. NPDC015131 TaxID=3364941 RepID=UPI0036FEF186
MSTSRTPAYMSGRRGRSWTRMLRLAERKGAVIVTDETGERVVYSPDMNRWRHWWSLDGKRRFDSFECHPEF